VGKEKTSLDIVWICVGFLIFVVDSMSSAPIVNGILEGERLHRRQEEAEWEFGFERPVTPISMSPRSSAQGIENIEKCICKSIKEFLLEQ